MWARTEHVHPSVRRFLTHVDLQGNVLIQEVAGQQQRVVTLMGGTHADAVSAVRATENTDFVEGIAVQMKDQIHMGFDCFEVSITSSRKLPPGVTDDGGYSYGG